MHFGYSILIHQTILESLSHIKNEKRSDVQNACAFNVFVLKNVCLPEYWQNFLLFFLLFRLVTIIVTFFISLNRIDASRDKNSRMLIVSLRTLNINVDKYTYIYIQGINIFAE